MPAPSPSTKPSRSLSNGRLARAGSSLRCDSARSAANPPTPMWQTAASAPPVIIASAAPRLMISNESPIACADAVHAVHVARFGPLAPKRIETWPAARLMIAEGMKNGEILRGPAFEVGAVLLLDGGEPADARADEHADARRQRRVDRQLRIVHRVLRSRDGELNEDVHLLQFLLFDELQRIEVLHFAREPCRKGRRVETRDRADAAGARAQRIPVRLSAHADRRHQTHAGHYDSPVHLPPDASVGPASAGSDVPLAGPRYFFLACDSM